MCPPDKLNDPFEGGFLISDIKKYQNKEFIDKLLRISRNNFIDDFAYDERLEKAIQDENYFFNILSEYLNRLIKNRYGITCFSRNARSLNMWSHYADSHKGVCLIFDEQKLKRSVFSSRTGVNFNDVIYSRNLPFLEIIDSYDDENGPECIELPYNNRFLFNKLNSWKEEKEVRLILEHQYEIFENRDLKFDKTCLVGMIFGYRTEIDNSCTIIKLISDSNQSHKVDFYMAKKGLDKPSLLIEKLKI